MKRKNNTFRHVIACALVFVLFSFIFAGLGMALFVVGIYWAFTVFFSVGWWASLLIIFGVLAIYATALSFALEMIRGEEE